MTAALPLELPFFSVFCFLASSTSSCSREKEKSATAPYYCVGLSHWGHRGFPRHQKLTCSYQGYPGRAFTYVLNYKGRSSDEVLFCYKTEKYLRSKEHPFTFSRKPPFLFWSTWWYARLWRRQPRWCRCSRPVRCSIMHQFEVPY